MSSHLSVSTGKSAACSRIEALEQRLACLADAGPDAINERLTELEWEWTSGRMAKVAAAVVVLAGTVLVALTGSWWWMILTAAGGLLMLQYSFSKTSWLAGMFREMGYRTGAEVEQEKFALRTLRGDFRHLPTVHDIEAHDDIARLEGEGGIVVETEAHKVDPKEAVKEVIEATKP
ncbi:MAG TPA: hypothetical protein VKE74_33480 [Gemmataceae bacterium]|nr:hypothetical protein [Gemmataceae bacterium]